MARHGGRSKRYTRRGGSMRYGRVKHPKAKTIKAAANRAKMAANAASKGAKMAANAAAQAGAQAQAAAQAAQAAAQAAN